MIYYKAEPDWAILGKKLLKKMKDVKEAISNMNSDELKLIKENTLQNEEYEFEVGGCKVLGRDVVIKRLFIESEVKKTYSNLVIENNSDVSILLDINSNEELELENFARQFKSYVQKSRKNNGVQIDDLIDIFVDINNDKFIDNSITQFNDLIVTTLKSEIKRVSNKNEWNKVIVEDQFDYNQHKIKI